MVVLLDSLTRMKNITEELDVKLQRACFVLLHLQALP